MTLTWEDVTCECGGVKWPKSKRCSACHYHDEPKQPSTGTRICPTCAGPKSYQALLCQWCWYDKQKAECGVEHGTRCPCPPCRKRESRKRTERRRRAGELKGTPTGRPQPQDHPWRQKVAA